MTSFLVFSSFLAILCITALEAEAVIAPDEREALRLIEKSLGQRRWNFGVDPCSGLQGWDTKATDKNFENAVNCSCSVGTDGFCHVIGIAIKRQSLPGVLPPELARLRFLQRIDLTRNFLNGTIPKEWASMPSLQIISMGQNRLSGRIPQELGNISSLLELVLDTNRLSGSIPRDIRKLVNLKRLLISSNNLTGELPLEIGNLKSLEDLRISDNHFRGKIPDFIQNLTGLKTLAIQASGLEGPIPSAISHLTNLTDLTISDINGTESSFPPLDQMKQMKTLILRSCNLSGPIPKYVGLMTDLKTLDLSFNKFTGSIPRTFDNLVDTKFMYLTGNMLSGPVPPRLLSKVNLDLSYNNYTWQSTCPDGKTKTNYFGSSSTGNSSFPCSKEKFVCTTIHHSLYINCGGSDVEANGTPYERDMQDSSGAATYWSSYGNNWAISNTGNFLDNGDEDRYTVTPTTPLTMPNPELYETARSSPLSLTYYGLCLKNESYTVKLHFAEIVFTDNNTYSSLGRRIFDVYIQGNLIWKDFNIEEEAQGVGKAIVKEFPVNITRNSLEIRLYWAGKGTTGIPEKGNYGPLISAISVVPNFGVSSGNKKTVAIVVGTLVPVICILGVVVGILWKKGILGGKSTMEKDLRGLDLQTGSFTLRQIKYATNNFAASNKIGEGGFGPVYKGLLADGTIIAVKQLSSKSKQGNREFVNEIGMISALQHPNLVKLHGCCIEGNQLLLVYEYMENNCLARALFGPEEKQLKLDWPSRQRICIGIARGLAYLHEESRLKIVHRDIKATNVLLDKDFNPKISDFGLAKLDEEENTHISTRIAGTIGYMAPEYATRGYLTDKADVYSFGIVALEIVSGKSNTNMRNKDDRIYLLDLAQVLQRKGNLLDLVDPKLGTEINKEEAMVMIKVALLCTNASSILRPSMSAVVSMLEGRRHVKEPTASYTEFSDIDLNLHSISHEDGNYNGASQTQTLKSSSSSMSQPFSGSSTSAPDLYPVKLDSNYWNQR